MRVEPVGIVLVPDEGESVFHCAEREGFRWPTVCGGTGSCRACFMTVEAGGDLLEMPDSWEQEGLATLVVPPGAGAPRLACQSKFRAGVRGQAVVRKRGVRPE